MTGEARAASNHNGFANALYGYGLRAPFSACILPSAPSGHWGVGLPRAGHFLNAGFQILDSRIRYWTRPDHGDFIFNSMTKRKCVALLPTVWKEPWCGWEQLGMENESYRWSIGRNFFPRCAPRHPPWPLNYRLTF